MKKPVVILLLVFLASGIGYSQVPFFEYYPIAETK